MNETTESIAGCRELRERLWGTREPTRLDAFSKELLDRFRDDLQRQWAESKSLGWRFTIGAGSVSLDTNGVFVVRGISGHDKPIVITAYLPGFGTSEGTRRAQLDPQNPHAREVSKSSMRQGRGRSRQHQRESDISDRLRERRAAAWTEDQRVYYLVFRPVLQAIAGYQPGERQYAASLDDLKPMIPRLSTLSFESWMKLRQPQGVRV